VTICTIREVRLTPTRSYSARSVPKLTDPRRKPVFPDLGTPRLDDREDEPAIVGLPAVVVVVVLLLVLVRRRNDNPSSFVLPVLGRGRKSMIANSTVIDGYFIVHWIITSALMLALFFGIRYALREQ
jgi:hypothetical protein